MFERFYPDEYVSSVYTLDFKKLYDMGYKAIIFDIDNTLVPHNAPADKRSKELFEKLKNIGFKTLLLSNNAEPRVKEFYNAVNADEYIFKGKKPNPKGYEKAMKIMGSNTQSTLFIGDQIFTDIWGAKRTGIKTIMVEPILKWKEEIQIILKRLLEAIVIAEYKKYRRGGILD